MLFGFLQKFKLRGRFMDKKIIYDLAIVLIDMLEQHATNGRNGRLFDDGLSANENAIGALYKIGIIDVKRGKNYINFDKLEQLKK
jgi:hypothetical protein